MAAAAAVEAEDEAVAAEAAVGRTPLSNSRVNMELARSRFLPSQLENDLMSLYDCSLIKWLGGSVGRPPKRVGSSTPSWGDRMLQQATRAEKLASRPDQLLSG